MLITVIKLCKMSQPHAGVALYNELDVNWFVSLRAEHIRMVILSAFVRSSYTSGWTLGKKTAGLRSCLYFTVELI